MSRARSLIWPVAIGAVVIIVVVVALATRGRSPEPTATATAVAAPTATVGPTVAVTAMVPATAELPATAVTEATTAFTSPITTFSSPLNFDSPIATPTFEVFDTSGVVYGQVIAVPPGWQRATVWLAPFTPVSDDGKTGFYVLEPSVHPWTEMYANGYFQFTSVPPGQYVIITGPNPEEALPAKENGNSRVIDVKAGEVLDVGQFALP